MIILGVARFVTVDITINSKDVSRDIAPFLKSVRIEDVLDGESNTAEIELEDRGRLWTNAWFPSRGDTVDIALRKNNWSGEGELEFLSFNSWEIDTIENSFPPNIAKIKMTSIAQNSNLRSADKSRSWENVHLSKICNDIADSAGLNIFYDTEIDPEIERAEQKNQSDLSFLHRLCKDYGIAVRVSESKLIIFDEEKLERQDPVSTLIYGDAKIKSFSATATLSEIYSSAKVEYSHGKKKQKISGEYSDSSKGDGKTLQIKKKVSSQAEAERLAKKELRDKNKKEIQIRLSVIGDFYYLSGNVLALDENFGFYAGNYIIERVTHSVGTGYECDIELRKCLSGY